MEPIPQGVKHMEQLPREYTPATKPTFYFVGVTTSKSSIMKVFPKWAEYLRLGDVEMKGFDFKPHDEPASYRECVEFIKKDPLSLGALVTTHKIDLLNACRDLFDYLDPHADYMGEISCISKRDNVGLRGHAKDPITSGFSIEAYLPENYWKHHPEAKVFLMGAGGSSIAISSYLAKDSHGENKPAEIIISNRSEPRLKSIQQIHQKNPDGVVKSYHQTPQPADNDALLATLPPYSLVINATGLGKDAPGSPLTNSCGFPDNGIVWELNYRGDLIFLDQASNQKESRRLQIEDGWIYFIHGWTQVIAEVFDIDIQPRGKMIEELSVIAARNR
jgi:shikimate 5-dehydrogenase